MNPHPDILALLARTHEALLRENDGPKRDLIIELRDTLRTTHEARVRAEETIEVLKDNERKLVAFAVDDSERRRNAERFALLLLTHTGPVAISNILQQELDTDATIITEINPATGYLYARAALSVPQGEK